MARTTCFRCGAELDGSHKVYCKACFAAYARERRASNPELRAVAARKAKEWREAHPGHTAKYNRDRYASDPEFWNDYHKKWRAENPESRKATRRMGHLKSLYGMSIQDFERMMYEQSNLCLICNNEMTVGTRDGRTVNVDHDHDSGDIRGLLCTRCNNGLGCFDDNPDLMIAAAAYVMRYQITHEEK
jgi:hypothetical protein